MSAPAWKGMCISSLTTTKEVTDGSVPRRCICVCVRCRPFRLVHTKPVTRRPHPQEGHSRRAAMVSRIISVRYLLHGNLHNQDCLSTTQTSGNQVNCRGALCAARLRVYASTLPFPTKRTVCLSAHDSLLALWHCEKTQDIHFGITSVKQYIEHI